MIVVKEKTQPTGSDKPVVNINPKELEEIKSKNLK